MAKTDGIRGEGLHGRGNELVIISTTFLGVALLLVGMRMVTKRVWGKGWGWDDYIIVISLIFSGGMTAADVLAVNFGFGNPSATLTPADRHDALKNFFVIQILYKIVMCLTKVSILVLYLQIFTSKVYRRCTWISIGAIVCYTCGSVLVTIFQCSPLSDAWGKTPGGICVNLTIFWYCNAAFNILTDAVTLVLPWQMVFNLQIPRRQKIGLILVFALGVFVVVTSILRTTTLENDSKAPDPTSGTFTSAIWTSIEANTGIICACLPMLKQPLTKIWPRLFSNRSRSQSYSSSTSHRARTNSTATHQSCLTARRATINHHRFQFRVLQSKRKDGDIELGNLMPPQRKQNPPSTRESEDHSVRYGENEVPQGQISKTTDVDIRFDETEKRTRSALS